MDFFLMTQLAVLQYDFAAQLMLHSLILASYSMDLHGGSQLSRLINLNWCHVPWWLQQWPWVTVLSATATWQGYVKIIDFGVWVAQ